MGSELAVCSTYARSAGASGSPGGEAVGSLVLTRGVDVTHGKVAHDLRHVLVLEERVPAGLVWKTASGRHVLSP